jgi:hypothetical protein
MYEQVMIRNVAAVRHLALTATNWPIGRPIQ